MPGTGMKALGEPIWRGSNPRDRPRTPAIDMHMTHIHAMVDMGLLVACLPLEACIQVIDMRSPEGPLSQQAPNP